MFNNDELGIALRAFQCGRLDLSADTALRAKYGAKAPLFVAFDPEGKPQGELLLAGYKANAAQLVQLLEKTAGAVVKPSLQAFVKDYRDVVHDLELIDGRRKVLQDRQGHIDGKSPDAARKRAELDKERKDLDAEQQKIEAREQQLLTSAKLPARNPDAK